MPIPPPTFNGVAIFGLGPTIVSEPLPARMQITTFPGVPGSQVNKLGGTGFQLEIEGLLDEPNMASMVFAEQVFENLVGLQTTGTLVDTSNLVAWLEVTFLSFKKVSERMPKGPGGLLGYQRLYKATAFTPLVPTLADEAAGEE